MRTFTKGFGVAAAAGVLLAASISPASADTINSTVSGSSLSATTSGATLGAVTLNGTGTQTATASASSGWSITDARGTGALWTLSASATAPTSAAGSVETVARSLPVGNLSIVPGTVTAAAGADATTGITATTVTLSGTGQALVSATGPNKGTYNLTPTYNLTIPANAYRSNYAGAVGSTALNPYTSTVTYTIG